MLNAFEMGDLALQNLDLAGVWIDAADGDFRLGFQCLQELPQTNKIGIGMRTRHVAIIFRYQRPKSSFPLETRGNFVAKGKMHSKFQRGSRAGCQWSRKTNAEENREAAYSARALRDARVILCWRLY